MVPDISLNIGQSIFKYNKNKTVKKFCHLVELFPMRSEYHDVVIYVVTLPRRLYANFEG